MLMSIDIVIFGHLSYLITSTFSGKFFLEVVENHFHLRHLRSRLERESFLHQVTRIRKLILMATIRLDLSIVLGPSMCRYKKRRDGKLASDHEGRKLETMSWRWLLP